MQTDPPPPRRLDRGLVPQRFGAPGDALATVAGLVVAVAGLTGWYTGTSVEGPQLAVIGWHTGALGKVFCLVGLAVLALAALRRAGILELPPALPEPLLVIVLGVVATVCVLIRVISIPDSFVPAAGRGIGLWVSLAAALGLIGAGLVRAAEEL